MPAKRIDGDFEQTAAGELHLDLFAHGPGGVAYDKLMVSGEAVLAGSLVLNLHDGFVPLPGQSFAVLSAGTLVASGLRLAGPGAEMFSMSAVGSDLVLTFATADFDGNGSVNADDLAVWQDQFGGSAGGQGDGDNDGDVDGADFLRWQRHLEAPVAAPINASVPEPSGLALGVSMTILGVMLRRRSTSTQAT